MEPGGGLPRSQDKASKPLALNMKAPKKSPFQVSDRRQEGGGWLGPPFHWRLTLFDSSRTARSFTRRRRRQRRRRAARLAPAGAPLYILTVPLRSLPTAPRRRGGRRV